MLLFRCQHAFWNDTVALCFIYFPQRNINFFSLLILLAFKWVGGLTAKHFSVCNVLCFSLIAHAYIWEQCVVMEDLIINVKTVRQSLKCFWYFHCLRSVYMNGGFALRQQASKQVNKQTNTLKYFKEFMFNTFEYFITLVHLHFHLHTQTHIL